MIDDSSDFSFLWELGDRHSPQRQTRSPSDNVSECISSNDS